MISLHNMLPFELTKDTPYLYGVSFMSTSTIDRVIKGFYCNGLTHWGLGMLYDDIDLGQYWLR